MDKLQQQLCKEWGYEMRRKYNGHPRTGILGRLMAEGEGASIRGWGNDHVPRVEFTPEHLNRISRAWRGKMSALQANVFYIHFVSKGSMKMKAESLGLSRREYYGALGDAMTVVFLV
jgi:hypothetical protein